MLFGTFTAATWRALMTENVHNLSRRRVLVFASTFPPAFLGGDPIRSLDALVRSAPDEFEVLVFAADRDLGQQIRLEVSRQTWVRRGTVLMKYGALYSLI